MTESAPATTSTGPDAGSIARDEGHHRKIEVESTRTDGFAVVIQQAVLDTIQAHGKSNTKVEVCGVLVGKVWHDDAGPYLLIHASIAGNAASSHAANVTFTAETWTQIHAEMDKSFPNDRIVGWYHTHPGFDIFLSEMDLFIQRNFFDLPWQVAYVYDPLRGHDGMFVWRNGVPTIEQSIIEPAQQSPVETSPQELPTEVADDEDEPSRVFIILVLLFVAALLVALIVFEYKAPPTKPAEPLSKVVPQWSEHSQWTANR